MRTIILLALFLSSYGAAQAQTVEEIQTAARDHQRSGNYENAISVLNTGLATYPNNLDLLKDLALTHYLTRDYKKGLEAINKALKTGIADDQSFQVAAMLYKGELNLKEGEIVLKTGLKQHPKSGMLYAEYGELLEAKTPGMGQGLLQWEAGIKADPAYPVNYYKAANALAQSNQWIGGMVYAEVYCNLDSYTGRTTEMKNLLLDCLKKAISPGNATLLKTNGKFEEAVQATFKPLASMAKPPLTPEGLSALRARFLLQWMETYGKQFPYKLFDYQQQLLREGLFDAYTQWLLGPTSNLAAFDNWVKTHDREYKGFTDFKRNRVFSMPEGQYYK